jgi:DNA-binding response OmpR family regulator
VAFEACSPDGGSFLEISPLGDDGRRNDFRDWDQALSLTRMERAVLSVLASNAERLVSREKIRDRVWRSDRKVDLRTIDAHIVHIRKKLRRVKSVSMPVIQTVWGLGYKLRYPLSNHARGIRARSMSMAAHRQPDTTEFSGS